MESTYEYVLTAENETNFVARDSTVAATQLVHCTPLYICQSQVDKGAIKMYTDGQRHLQSAERNVRSNVTVYCNQIGQCPYSYISAVI